MGGGAYPKMKDYEEWEKQEKKEDVEDYCGLSSLGMKEILRVVSNKGKNKQTNKHALWKLPPTCHWATG